MIEPVWGEKFLKVLNSYMAQHDILIYWVPILADVFVFSYPIYLVVLYLYAIVKKQNKYKEFSLLLFFAWFGSIFVNVLVQMFVEKVRPDVILNLFVEWREALLLDTLPKNTFPSDHAAMAAAIATVSLIWGFKEKNKVIIWVGFVMSIFAVVMWFGRITMGIHWPTDILVGTLIGVAFSFLIFQKHVLSLLRKTIFRWIVDFQEWLWEKVFWVRA